MGTYPLQAGEMVAAEEDLALDEDGEGGGDEEVGVESETKGRGLSVGGERLGSVTNECTAAGVQSSTSVAQLRIQNP